MSQGISVEQLPISDSFLSQIFKEFNNTLQKVKLDFTTQIENLKKVNGVKEGENENKQCCEKRVLKLEKIVRKQKIKLDMLVKKVRLLSEVKPRNSVQKMIEIDLDIKNNKIEEK